MVYASGLYHGGLPLIVGRVASLVVIAEFRIPIYTTCTMFTYIPGRRPSCDHAFYTETPRELFAQLLS